MMLHLTTYAHMIHLNVVGVGKNVIKRAIDIITCDSHSQRCQNVKELHYG